MFRLITVFCHLELVYNVQIASAYWAHGNLLIN